MATKFSLAFDSTKEDFFKMKTTQNQKFVKKNNLDHTLGLGLIEDSTKEDFFKMKTTQNQKNILRKQIGSYFRVRVN
jgi:hypothetical protein